MLPDPDQYLACGAATRREDEWPHEWTWSCTCFSCLRCGMRYREDDDDGVTIAATEELAEQHPEGDMGWCAACWKEVTP